MAQPTSDLHEVEARTQPVRRRVALKVIKLGMDTKQVVARFEAERQALAMMDHPNIAKVLDAGTTELGRPYFVMELVRGIRITDYCDQAQLSTRERLDLFIKVCQAIQHAHQKGIIHRDIKPSNVLVSSDDSVPALKVIDSETVLLRLIPNAGDRQSRSARRTAYLIGEKSVGLMNIRSTFVTSRPSRCDSSTTVFHSGSSLNTFQDLSASSRFGCARI